MVSPFDIEDHAIRGLGITREDPERLAREFRAAQRAAIREQVRKEREKLYEVADAPERTIEERLMRVCEDLIAVNEQLNLIDNHDSLPAATAELQGVLPSLDCIERMLSTTLARATSLAHCIGRLNP